MESKKKRRRRSKGLTTLGVLSCTEDQHTTQLALKLIISSNIINIIIHILKHIQTQGFLTHKLKEKEEETNRT